MALRELELHAARTGGGPGDAWRAFSRAARLCERARRHEQAATFEARVRELEQAHPHQVPLWKGICARCGAPTKPWSEPKRRGLACTRCDHVTVTLIVD